ncbi:MAG TPA: prolyl oligopeptidase family serine peptidase [Drouetiella sp.]|jgi:prolyl oligopeptidase
MKRGTTTRSRPQKRRVFDCFEISTAAYQAYIEKDYRKSANLLLAWEDDFEKLGSRDEGAAYAFWLIGIALYMCDEFARCEPYLAKSARMYDVLDQKETMNCLWWRANSLQTRKQFKKAARVFMSVAEWAVDHGAGRDDVDIVDWYSRAYSQIGYCLWNAKDFDGALVAFDKCLRSDAPLVAVSGLVEKMMHLLTQSKNARHRAAFRKLIARANKIVDKGLKQLPVPETAVQPVVERRFGYAIGDPYRWLEDVHATRVHEWIALQNQYSNAYLEAIPGRSEMLKCIHKMFSAKPLKITYKIGPYYFTSDKPATKLYRSEKQGQFPELVLDSRDWPKDSRLSYMVISRNGKYVAYFVTAKGSDWQSIYVKNISTGKRVAGIIKDVRARTLTWDRDSKGFYYAAFRRGDDHCQIRYHKLHSSQAEDKLIYTIDEPDVYAAISIVGGSKYLMVTTYATKKTRHSIFLINIQSKHHKRLMVLDEQPYAFYFIGQNGDRVFFITDKNAPMFRIVYMSIRDVEQSARKKQRLKFHESLAEQSCSLKRAFKWGEFLVCIYATESGEIIRRWNTSQNKELKPIHLPTGTSITEFYYMDFPVIRMLIEGYTVPTTTYELNFQTGKLTTKSAYKMALDTGQFVTKKLYARSRDGSKVTFFVRHKKGLKLNGKNPTLLTGYGGFDRDIDPSCDNYDLLWMDLGGICVETILRGDAGFGAVWRKAGTRENKQRTFDDFIAVAQALIRKKYTEPTHLGISGFSNGGLLTGAVLTQRPDLFGAVEVGCGLLDMLRFHKFGTEKHYELEYGTATSKKFFEILHAYSPLQKVKKRAYPAVLINTGSHDDRVSPAHSYKFAATLQRYQTSDAPVLLNVEMNAGHEFSAQSNLGLNRLSFFGYELGLLPKAFLKRSISANSPGEKL